MIKTKNLTSVMGQRGGFELVLDVLRHSRNTPVSMIAKNAGTNIGRALTVVRRLVKLGMAEKAGKKYMKTAKGMEYLNMGDELIRDFGGQVGYVNG